MAVIFLDELLLEKKEFVPNGDPTLLYWTGTSTKTVLSNNVSGKQLRVTLCNSDGIPYSPEITDFTTMSGLWGSTSLNAPSSGNHISKIEVEEGGSYDLGKAGTHVGALFNLSSLTKIETGSELENIGIKAFEGASNLTHVRITENIVSIGMDAFKNCISLESITVLAETPPTLGTQAFDNTNNAPIYVPSDSVDAYKTATNWSAYADRIFAIEEEPEEPGEPEVRPTSLYIDTTAGVTWPLKLVKPEQNVLSVYLNSVLYHTFSEESTGNVNVDLVLPGSTYNKINIIANTGSYSFGQGEIHAGSILGEEPQGSSYLMCVDIGTQVIALGDYAVAGVRKTPALVIPPQVTALGSSALRPAWPMPLRTVYVENATPPVLGSNVFQAVSDMQGIYVPAGSVALYQGAEGWSIYTSKIQSLPATPHIVCMNAFSSLGQAAATVGLVYGSGRFRFELDVVSLPVGDDIRVRFWKNTALMSLVGRTIHNSAHFPIIFDVSKNDVISIDGRAVSSVDTVYEIRLEIYNDNTNEIISSFSLSKLESSGCYLTSAMAGYYGYADDCRELEALRVLRTMKGHEHQEMLANYKEESVIIIAEINKRALHEQDYYYGLIKTTAEAVADYIDVEDYDTAADVYLDLYLYFKELFIEETEDGN